MSQAKLQRNVDDISVVDRDSKLRMNFMPRSFGKAFYYMDSFYGFVASKTNPQYSGGVWDYAYTSAGRPFILYGDIGGECLVSTLHDDVEFALTNEIAGVLTTALTIIVVLEKKGSAISEDLRERLVELYYNLVKDGHEMAEKQGLGTEYYRLVD